MKSRAVVVVHANNTGTNVNYRRSTKTTRYLNGKVGSDINGQTLGSFGEKTLNRKV